MSETLQAESERDAEHPRPVPAGVVVIPAYQPTGQLPELCRQLAARGLEVLVVNDGSTEGLGNFDAARAAGATVLAHPENRGKGAALKTAFRHLIDGGFEGPVVTADADGQHLPEDIVRVAGAVREHPDSLVLGVRDVRAMPGRSRLGNTVISRLVGRRFGMRVEDTQTGLRGFWSGHLADALVPSGDRYEYEMAALLRAHLVFSGLVQVPVHTVYDRGNPTSHFAPVRDSLRILRLVLGPST